MRNIKYVVKSHQRVEDFGSKTYNKIILKYKFNLKNTFVFVSLQEDVESYSLKYPEINIVKSPKGVAAVDNFITDYFGEGQEIVYMNDDLKGLYSVNDKLKFDELSLVECESLINNSFETMQENNISYGGIYPILNGMFMSGGEDIKFGFCFIQDPFSFCINNKKIKITISDKSDYEKSILHFRDKGALLRNNRYSMKVENYVKKGGFQGRNSITEKDTAEKMVSLYPLYVNNYKTKKNGVTSLRLKRINCQKNIIKGGVLIKEVIDLKQISLF
tara:strand:- start:89 stop:910 length:822 start_codon:yes stop_codon:yes gene_type:complete